MYKQKQNLSSSKERENVNRGEALIIILQTIRSKHKEKKFPTLTTKLRDRQGIFHIQAAPPPPSPFCLGPPPRGVRPAAAKPLAANPRPPRPPRPRKPPLCSLGSRSAIFTSGTPSLSFYKKHGISLMFMNEENSTDEPQHASPVRPSSPPRPQTQHTQSSGFFLQRC